MLILSIVLIFIKELFIYTEFTNQKGSLMKTFIALSSLFIASSSMYANQVQLSNWKNSMTMVQYGNDYIFNYDRLKMSVENQDRNEAKKALEKAVCAQSEAVNTIKAGSTLIYNYIYSDGTITITINSCN